MTPSQIKSLLQHFTSSGLKLDSMDKLSSLSDSPEEFQSYCKRIFSKSMYNMIFENCNEAPLHVTDCPWPKHTAEWVLKNK